MSIYFSCSEVCRLGWLYFKWLWAGLGSWIQFGFRSDPLHSSLGPTATWVHVLLMVGCGQTRDQASRGKHVWSLGSLPHLQTEVFVCTLSLECDFSKSCSQEWSVCSALAVWKEGRTWCQNGSTWACLWWLCNRCWQYPARVSLAHTVWHMLASYCNRLPKGFLWPWSLAQPVLGAGLSGWEWGGQGANTSRSSPRLIMDWKCLSGGTTERVVTWSDRCLQQDWAPATHGGDLLFITACMDFPPYPPLTSPISYSCFLRLLPK